jgi:hypothetical protein
MCIEVEVVIDAALLSWRVVHALNNTYAHARYAPECTYMYIDRQAHERSLGYVPSASHRSLMPVDPQVQPSCDAAHPRNACAVSQQSDTLSFITHGTRR